MEEERLLHIWEVARLLSFSRSTIYKMIGRGELVAGHMGGRLRVHPASVRAYMRSHGIDLDTIQAQLPEEKADKS